MIVIPAHSIMVMLAIKLYFEKGGRGIGCFVIQSLHDTHSPHDISGVILELMAVMGCCSCVLFGDMFWTGDNLLVLWYICGL